MHKLFRRLPSSACHHGKFFRRFSSGPLCFKSAGLTSTNDSQLLNSKSPETNLAIPHTQLKTILEPSLSSKKPKSSFSKKKHNLKHSRDSDEVEIRLLRVTDLHAKISANSQKSFGRNKSASKFKKSQSVPHNKKLSTPCSTSEELNNSENCTESIVIADETPFVQAKKPVASEIPRLAHGLDKVLFSPGVHFLQDPRTKIFNFTKYLERIRPYEDFDPSKFPGFISASKDQTLLKEAIAQNKTFYSSTSSMTLTLIQFYFLLNNYTSHPNSESRFNFPAFSRNATTLPLCLIVEPKGVTEHGKTIYSITSDKSTDIEILLLALGHCLEALLTTEENEFAHYLIKSPGEASEEKSKQSSDPTTAKDETEEDKAVNIYNYSSYKGFLMRSQLDCYDSRLPGNGTFDLKTRAACAIRYDQHPDSAKTNYRITKLRGSIESFEREYNDLIKTGGLLKYGLQARIGQMDGIFVAYHNVNSFSGFQYLPLSEIDKVFYSDQNVEYQIQKFHTPEETVANDHIASYVAENQFKVSLSIWEDVMKTVNEDLKGTEFDKMPYRLIFKRMTSFKRSRGKVLHSPESFMRVFAVPLTEDKLTKLQNFPTRFKTSFRENLPQDERLENLIEAEKELQEINAEMVENAPILCYRITTSYHVKGSNISALGKHPYPRKVDQEHEWRYKIEKESKILAEDVIKGSYLRLMDKAATVITMGGKMASSKKKVSDITRIVRKYGEVGRIREEQWNKLQAVNKTTDEVDNNEVEIEEMEEDLKN